MSSSLFRFLSSEVYRAETLYSGFPTARRCSVSLNLRLTPHLSSDSSAEGVTEATAYCGLCTTGSIDRSLMLVFSSLKHTQEVSKVKFVEAFSLNFEL